MQLFTILVIVFGILAGVVNFGYGLLHRNRIWIAAMRFGVGVISLVIAGVALANQLNVIALPGMQQLSLIYTFIALGLFVGGTFMLPATIERNVLPAEEQPHVTPRQTGKLGGNPPEPGIRLVNQTDDWVN